jgi:hypothetical protein
MAAFKKRLRRYQRMVLPCYLRISKSIPMQETSEACSVKENILVFTKREINIVSVNMPKRIGRNECA